MFFFSFYLALNFCTDVVVYGQVRLTLFVSGVLLTTGMVDIARQTVEFLYEENGGIPRDLYLPTIEDIKDEANKFTIDKVRKGRRHLHHCYPSNATSV